MTTASTELGRATAAAAPAELKLAWTTYRGLHPHTRIRDAARELGVGEAQLLATDCGAGVTRLAAPEGNWGAMIENLKPLGRVMALTRNNEAVHERKGEYSRTELFPAHDMGQVLDEGIDLRLFFSVWAHAFAIDEEAKAGQRRRSIQFFDASGEAIHKVFLQDEGDTEAFAAYVARHRADDQTPALGVRPAPAAPIERADTEVDVEAFRREWLVMTNTHEFFGLTRKFSVTRTQALRLAPPDMVRRVNNSSLRTLLERVARDEMPIMIFVGNGGCIQIHSGAVKNVKVMGEWLNVLDPDFNLHVREDLINRSWVVRKPTNEGVVTSLEMYNAGGEQIALVFSKRKDYKEEAEAWRDVLKELPGA